MDCEAEEFGASRDFWYRFGKTAYQNRIPVFGGIELTPRCNLRCVHCYIHTPSVCAEMTGSLSAERLHRLVDEIADAGCLFLLLTGGEPLLHPEFCALYRRARERGISVSVYTNGTLLNERHVALFQELPPRAIDISLYGATAETYEKITQAPGSYARCVEGIERLLAARVPLRLKTIGMTLNRHEFQDIRRLARDWGCEFRSSEAIFPALDGDLSPLQWRITPEEALELEAQDPAVLAHWRSRDAWRRKDYYSADALYECTAGASAFHVGAGGFLHPCSGVRAEAYRFDLNQGSFLEGWNGLVGLVTRLKKAKNAPCHSCLYRAHCHYCPPKISTADGVISGTEYRCVLARRMYEKAKGTTA